MNTQTLLQYGQISEKNLGSMVNLVGSADQQMASQAGVGMSATPQGVEAQQAMVDITTNNYQKAIESFFSHYCSYALTIYFHELKAVKKVKPTAEARLKLVKAGLAPELVHRDGTLDMDFGKLATEYWVRTVPGSLVEMEDEKQLKILNQLFVPLSQAMPALAASDHKAILQQAAMAMQYIIKKQIELSGSSSAKDIGLVFEGKGPEMEDRDAKLLALETGIHSVESGIGGVLDMSASALKQMQEQIAMLAETQGLILQKLGAPSPSSGAPGVTAPQAVSTQPAMVPNVRSVSA